MVYHNVCHTRVITNNKVQSKKKKSVMLHFSNGHVPESTAPLEDTIPVVVGREKELRSNPRHSSIQVVGAGTGAKVSAGFLELLKEGHSGLGALQGELKKEEGWGDTRQKLLSSNKQGGESPIDGEKKTF